MRVESEGIGVTSSILPIFIPERAKALRADWAPGPGVLVRLPPKMMKYVFKIKITFQTVRVYFLESSS